MKAKATGYLELNIKGFTEAISQAKKLLIGLGAAFVSFKAASAIKNSIVEAVDYGNEIYHLTQKMYGLGAGNATLMKGVAEQLGLNVEELMSAAENYAEAGLKMDSMFRYKGAGNGLIKALAQAESGHKGIAEIMQRRAADFSYIADRLRAVSNKTRDFWIGFTDSIAGPIAVTANKIISFDFAKAGKDLGKWVEPALNVINGLMNSATPFKDLWSLIKYAFLAAGDYIYEQLIKAAEAFGDIIANKIGALFGMGGEPPKKEPKDGRTNLEKLQEVVMRLIISGKYGTLGLDAKPEINHEALKPFENYKTISDSLQSVGGGGNYAITSMSVEQRTAKHQDNMEKIANEIVAAQKGTTTAVEKIPAMKSK